MIKHIVMWKIKEFAEGNDRETNIAIAKQKLTDLCQKLPLVKSFEYGRGYKTGEMDYDVALTMTFESKQDLQDYLDHPDHKVISAFISKIRNERAAADYVMD